jgi:putative DNA primase/helicase
VIQRAPPRLVTAAVSQEIKDHFDTEVVRWLERHGVMVKPDVVRRVVDMLARRSRFHPVQDYLESLPPWDGVPRTRSWLIDYCGVESDPTKPSPYAMGIGEKFLISAVARVMNPGCKVDHSLVLEGAQGLGKSTVPRILAGDEWFSDQISDIGSKDASMQLRGVWILELSELTAVLRSDPGRVKGFLTQQMERFRLPYGQRLVTVPRQCVFMGTTNSENWLKDETGGRRFWPVRCRALDLTLRPRGASPTRNN